MRYSGPEEIIKNSKSIVLNSRQSKMPRGKDQWVRNSFEAVKQAISRGNTIITSVGMNTWEFLIWAVGYNHGNQIIIVPIEEGEDEEQIKSDLIKDFELESERTGFMFFKAVKEGVRGKSAWPERDRILVSLANQFYPISVRKNGNLERLLKEHPAKFSEANLDFVMEYSPPADREPVAIAKSDLSDEIKNLNWNYLTHYTRSVYASWPGETSAQFYKSIYESGEHYPRSAFETLKRIIAEKKIRASNNHIRGGHKVVSFTELSPLDATKLIQWRPRYVRWNFEPYGIAIDKKYARSVGIRPAIYALPDEYDSLPDEDKPLFQNPGERGDWKPEKEWRFVGDLDFAPIPPSKIKLIQRNRSDQIETDYSLLQLTECS